MVTEALIIQLPLDTIEQIAKVGEFNLAALRNEWAVVHWQDKEDDGVGVLVDPDRELKVTGFPDRDTAAAWLADMYQSQNNIEAILHQGRPKKFEIEVKAKISLR